MLEACKVKTNVFKFRTDFFNIAIDVTFVKLTASLKKLKKILDDLDS